MAEPNAPDPFSSRRAEPASAGDLHGMTDVITQTIRAELGRQRAETPGMFTIGAGVMIGLWAFVLSVMLVVGIFSAMAVSSASKYVEDYKQRAGLAAPDASKQPSGPKAEGGSKHDDRPLTTVEQLLLQGSERAK